VAQHGGRARNLRRQAHETPEEILGSPKVVAFVKEKFAAQCASSGTSGRIKRVLLMTEPPSVDGHEITDKGYVNQRATLERRKILVDLLYENPPAKGVIGIG
jgi:feruloyl-CoA synthase